MLEHAQPVLDVTHYLPVILLVLLEELSVLLHLIIHLARKRLDLILESRIKIVEFLLELEERLEGLIVRRSPF
jgi:hypothetical protein